MQNLKKRPNRDVLAGVTTFLTMVYIVFVNPAILSQAGMDYGSVFTATCLVTAFACFLTGFLADIPIAVAPGMALNIYFSYSVVQADGMPWEQALALVFISGLLFLLITLTPFRRLLIEAIPHDLQIAILIGISLLIALIALHSNQLIIADAHTLLRLGELWTAPSLLFMLGFILILLLEYYQIKGSIILSILSVSLLSLLLNITSWQGIWSMPPSIAPTFLKMDLTNLMQPSALKAMFAFFLIAIFDATGTIIGLLSQSPFKEHPEHKKQLSRSLTADAIASVAAGLLGSASTSPYIESATGIRAGGRTGITNYVIGTLFLGMLFFFPLAKMIPSFAVGPALLYVACCMMKHMSELNFKDVTTAAPAMLTMLLIPYTSSIADGIGIGIILHTLLTAVLYRKYNLLEVGLSIVFILFFLIS
jgi:AGZA family xanthine/uracil permease-like MFS transporter